MTDNKTIQKIKTLTADAAALAVFNDLYARKYDSDTHCDKKGFGFDVDDRFSAFRIQTNFSSWAGYYGNSSCSNILHLSDSDTVASFIKKAMNQLQPQIFAVAADLMRKEAASLTDRAEAELSAMRDLLDAAKAA